MLDRRRAARLLSLVVAGLAVAGTSSTQPPPGPSQSLSLGGSLHLTADRPIAVQPLQFVVEQGDLASIALTPAISGAPDRGTILASIELADQTGTRMSEPATGSASGPPTSNWSFACQANPCAARYALVVTWLDAPAGADADVTWTVAATATYRGSVSAGATPGRVTLAAPPDAGDGKPSVELSRASSGKPARLTEEDRFRSWTVTLRRSDADRQAHGWPAVAQARLSLSATQVAGPPFAIGSDGLPGDSRQRTRTDPPVQLRVETSDGRAMTTWAADRSVDFDPFARCAGDGPCETALTVEIAWADGRPDTAFDAGWTLDLAAIAATGRTIPIESTVSADPRIHVATASTSGTFDEPGPFYQPAVQFVVVAPRFPDLAAADARRVPARALVTVTVTSVGPVPLPADADISVFGDGRGAGLGAGVILHPGETASLAFEPNGFCAVGATASCSARGSLGAVIYSPNRNTANVAGMVARIEWTIEAGVGTTDDGTAVVNIEPQPTRQP